MVSKGRLKRAIFVLPFEGKDKRELLLLTDDDAVVVAVAVERLLDTDDMVVSVCYVLRLLC